MFSMPEDRRSVVYTQAMETSRSFLTVGIQSASFLLVAYTTIVGFALKARSWGLLAADILLIVALLIIVWRVDTGVAKALTVARSYERAPVEGDRPPMLPPDMALADTLLHLRRSGRPLGASHIFLLLVIAAVLHVGGNSLAPTRHGWSYVGN